MKYTKLININTGEGIKTKHYPDGQPHVNIGEFNDPNQKIDILCSITDPMVLLKLQMTVNAIKRAHCIPGVLHIPYLMGARFDRVMEEGDSFDLEVIAEIINNFMFDRVYLFDPHSDVAPALIKNSYVVTNQSLVRTYNEKEAILIIPDAGAAKKVRNYFRWNWNLKDSIQCVKHRDLSTGDIKLTVLEPEKCKGRNCVIIDDLCDGGGTFNLIASQIEPLHLTLIVTHGIFSRGFNELTKNFNQIVVSDSFPHFEYTKQQDIQEIEKNFLKVIPYAY